MPILEEVRDQPERPIDALAFLDAQRFEVRLHLVDHDRTVLGQARPSGIGERELRGAPISGARLTDDESGLFEFGEELRRRRLRTQLPLREMSDPHRRILFDDRKRAQGRQRVLVADHSPKGPGQSRRDDDKSRYELT